MTQQASYRILVALVVAALVASTALFIVSMLRNKQRANHDPLRGGYSSGTSEADAKQQPRELREFTLIDQHGQPFLSRDMKGKVWIASFFFTRCPTVCPQVLAQTAELQKRLSALPYWNNIRLVSITVDPQHDTPAVLDERAKMWSADAKHWHFLTGTKDDIWQLTSARDGFQLAVGDAPNDRMSIAHSSRFVLIDAQHRVVGYYDALDEAKREELVREIDRIGKVQP